MTTVTVHPALAAEVAALCADYPRWRIFASDEGRIWAQRQHPRTRVRPWAFDCIDTDTPAQMRACLGRQHAGLEDP